jgi:hypothetical protein
MQIKLFFEADVKANDIEYAAALSYLFIVLYAFLVGSIEKELGLILLLSAFMIILSVRIERKQIKEEAEKKLKEISVHVFE